jgi:hypothetical protein
MTTKSQKNVNALCISQLKEAEEQVEQLEHRLQGSFDENRKLQQKVEEDGRAWDREKRGLQDEVKRLQEEVKHERRRSTQALDVAESTSGAADGIGRLLRVIVDNDVMETLRLASFEQRQEARERMRHRRPG